MGLSLQAYSFSSERGVHDTHLLAMDDLVSPYPPRRLHLILVSSHGHVFRSIRDVEIHLQLFSLCELEF